MYFGNVDIFNFYLACAVIGDLEVKQELVLLDEFDIAIKYRLNFENRTSDFGYSGV